MKHRILKSTTFKLILLLAIVLISLVSLSFLFNAQIDKLKTQIDKLYFGNLVPIVKLKIISDNYKKIITCRTMQYKCNYKQEEEIIKQEWSYYNKTYKNQKERLVVDSINEQITNSFKQNKLHKFKDTLKKIELLIDYEAQVAFKQRKAFLKDYDRMKSYLYFSIIVILILSFILIGYIILQIIRRDNQLRILNKRYKLEAITDSMTKLYNRKYFDTIFDNMPFIANANRWKCAFIMVDIDFFKQYNDTYGHDMGDETLKRVASTLKEYFNNKYEFVFRLGGEEFGVVLFDTDENTLKTCLRDINKKIVHLNIEHKNSKILDVVSISIGAVIYEPNTYISANRLYKKADECLYKSKESGRNQYHITKGNFNDFFV